MGVDRHRHHRAGMLDFGLSRALVRNVARERAQGGWSAISADFNSSFWPLLLSTSAITLLAWLLAPTLSAALGVPADLQPIATATLRVLCLSFVPTVLGLQLAATLEGAQRMGYTGSALVLNRVVFAIAAVAVILTGGSVLGVAAAHLLAVSLQFVFLLGAALWVTPSLRFSPYLVSRSRLRRDVRFGRFIFLTGLVALAFTATNKIVLARWLGLESVAYYELASLVALQLFAVALAVAQALYPAYASAQMEGGTASVQQLYASALRLAVLAFVPLGAAVVALAAPFVHAWFGSTAPESVVALRWLAAGWTLVGVAAVASVGLQAIGRPNWSALFSTYNAVINLVLALILVPLWGFWGILAANFVAISSSGLFTLFYFRKQCGLSIRQWLTALSPGVLLWMAFVATGLGWIGSRLPAPPLWQIVLLGAVYLACYVAGLFGLGLLRPDETAWLRAGIGRRLQRVELMP